MKRRDLFALLFASAAGPVWAQSPEKRHRLAIVRSEGNLAETKPPEMNPLWSVFFETLARNGYREGENLSVERFTAEARRDRHTELARAVVATKPDVIVANANNLVRHFKAATTTIPIIMFTGDPIAAGLVDNLARPGGNMTDVSADPGLEFHVKSLDYLRLVARGASRIGVLVSRELWDSGHWVPKQEIARRIGITLVPALVDPPLDEAALRRALAQIGQKNVDALLFPGEPEISFHFRHIIAWANESRVPATYSRAVHVTSGGLMSYHPDPLELYAHLAKQLAAVLKGTNPGDIPIYQPTKFRLFINLATAGEQEIDIPPTLLAAATDVIE